MDVVRLNRLARDLREIALRASQGGGDLPISVTELAVVEHVARHPGASVGDISRGTGVAQSRISQIVQQFTREGVFALERDPEDRRRTRVRLDAELRRRAYQDHGRRDIRAALAEALPKLSESEVEHTMSLLEELGELFESGA
ncbi:MarR family winged helix-turn-helix transcriptional regulator [Nocardia transvalensis]|uniref:MarR family winged helix-turn-helix transcriptional regulator n=1 Tax=Nocardia transvalensis TaxID=37333 RepID=UPI001894C7D9|nr:helix-turn-helix domain-containing protein [Nocardia transvalensis]MBF6329426.1 winged helix-turn-helix transcriptional regulator [Nocardia transvalensis]